MSPPRKVGHVEIARRDRVMQQVLVRMGRENLTYARAAQAIDVDPEALRKAASGQVTPSIEIVSKAEKWLESA